MLNYGLLMSVDIQKPDAISMLQTRLNETLQVRRSKRDSFKVWSRVAFGATTTALLAACEGNVPKAAPSPTEVAVYPAAPAAIVRDPETRFEIVNSDEIRYTEQIIKGFVKAGYDGSEQLSLETGEAVGTDPNISLKDWLRRTAVKVTSYKASRRIDNSQRGNYDLGSAVFSFGEQVFRFKSYQLDLYGDTDYDFSFRGDIGKDPTLGKVKKLINIPDSIKWKQYQPDKKEEIIAGWIIGLDKRSDGAITIVSVNNSGEVEYKYISASNPWIRDFESSFDKVDIPKLPNKLEAGEITDAKTTLSILKATFVEGGTDSAYDAKTKELRYRRNFDTLDGWIADTYKYEYDDKTSIHGPNGQASFRAEDRIIKVNGIDLIYTENVGLDYAGVRGSFVDGYDTTVDPTELFSLSKYFDIDIQSVKHTKLKSSDFPDNEGVVVEFRTKDGLKGSLIIDKYLHFYYSIDYQNSSNP